MRFKKIASVLASAAMVLGTVGFAAATTYPAPFVEDGVADVAIVYGSHPSAQSDMVGVVNIQNSLNSFVLSDSVTDDTTVEGGDYVQLEKASTKFHIGRGVLDVISGTITDDDLEVVLADGVYTDTNKDDKDYTQKLTLGNLSLSLFEDSDYQSDVPTVGIRAASGTFVLNYTLDFSDEPLWSRLANTEIEMMGKEYFISSITTNTTINLLDAANTALVNEGETVTVVAGDASYTVSATVFSATEAVLTVNGETTDGLDEGQTDKLSDGTYVGVKDIRYTARETGINQVEFSIGAGKIELKDGQDVKINDDFVNGLTTYLTTSSDSKLQEIVLMWSTDDDSFVTEDSNMVLPGLENIKFTFEGMYYPMEESFEVEKGSNTYVRLNSFPLKDGVADINLMYGNGTDFTGTGREATKKLRTSVVNSIIFDADTDEYFVATYNDGTDAESYLMRATGFVTETSVNKTTIQYYNDGDWTSKKEDAVPTDTINLGSVSLTVNEIDKNAKTVNITAGTTSVNFHTLFSEGGLMVHLPYEYTSTNYTLDGAGTVGVIMTNITAPGWDASNTLDLVFSEEDRNENTAQKNFTAVLGWTSSKTTVSSIGSESPDSGLEEGDSDVFKSFVYGPLATMLRHDTGGDQDHVEVTYHGGESYGKVFLTAYAASVGGNGGGSIGAPILDTEIAQASGKNLVVVGGSCVNTVAADLLGRSARFCGEEWTAATGIGQDTFLIQTFARTGGDVATLVAGWNAIDTQNAAIALTTVDDVDTSAGMKYTGTTANSIESVVTA
ncbi:MAG: hypothetical protein ABH864_01735 [archaeon]